MGLRLNLMFFPAEVCLVVKRVVGESGVRSSPWLQMDSGKISVRYDIIPWDKVIDERRTHARARTHCD